ncbi:hypothetical protein TNCT_436881 [Trichonephila clavata]|uniref:Uncharacterized protein n=1 Tax=Trichonephila clavata TaxID=2740835 RepID=A0A8X6LR44_TRICU|nr:hypothetical protein TNCT_436881 [Trichonephila clavata]
MLLPEQKEIRAHIPRDFIDTIDGEIVKGDKTWGVDLFTTLKQNFSHMNGKQKKIPKGVKTSLGPKLRKNAKK